MTGLYYFFLSEIVIYYKIEEGQYMGALTEQRHGGNHELPRRINIFESPALPLTERSIPTRVGLLVEAAKQDALARLLTDDPRTSERRRERVIKVIEHTFQPYVEENEIIAEQITSPEYLNFVSEIGTFLGTKPGAMICSDERIDNISIFDPRVGHTHRRAGAELEFTPLADGRFVLNDPLITEAITNSVQVKKKSATDKEARPKFFELVGGHIDSEEPTNGCGAEKAKAIEAGRDANNAMRLGRLRENFTQFNNGKFEAINNTIEGAGGQAVTIDMVHDLRTQGLILGLKYVIDHNLIDRNQSLSDNLKVLEKNKHILMTTSLDKTLAKDLSLVVKQFGLLDRTNPYDFAKNTMIIGRVAKLLTEKHAADYYSQLKIPQHIIEQFKNDPDYTRTFAYHAIRNSVYRTLFDIKPGDDHSIHHNAKLTRAGKIGAAFNPNHRSLIQALSHDEIRDVDIDRIRTLHSLLHEETKIIVVTDEFNLIETEKDKANFEKVRNRLHANADKLRKAFHEGIEHGETVVIEAIHKSGSRQMIYVPSSI